MYFIDNLYENIFERNLPRTSELNIISGYASPQILYKTIKKYPNIRMNLFIGMALEGISYDDHKMYIALTKLCPTLKIYYKVNYPLNHIKLYSFFMNDNSTKNYIGSANFSEAGLLHNEELIIESSDNFQKLFKKIELKSLPINHEDIKKYITFYDKDNNLIDIDEEDTEELSETSKVLDPSEENKNAPYTPPRKRLIRRFKYAHQADLKIPIILQENIQPNNRGINAWMRQQIPYLEQSTNYIFSRYFPLDTEFDIITDLEESLKGKINSVNDNRMMISPNIYEYLRRRLNLYEHREITIGDLVKYGTEEIWVEKLKDKQYFFDFSPKNDRKRS